MSLYLRYFDNETLVANVDDAIAFLYSISEIGMTPELEQDVRHYVGSDANYPKRYKVRSRVYFIIIKTEARTLAEFKARRNGSEAAPVHQQGGNAFGLLNREQPGWYEGVLDFKRVMLIPRTGKYQYFDTHFVARVKALSGMDCYNRIVSHLMERVDQRSQFPSPKGKNFHFTYLGAAK